MSGYNFNLCTPKRYVAVIHIHGLADQIAPYQPWTYPGVARWRSMDHCPKSKVTYAAPLHNDLAQGCRDGTAVNLYLVDSMAHIWPSQFDPFSPRGVDATSMIWNFFAAHGRTK